MWHLFLHFLLVLFLLIKSYLVKEIIITYVRDWVSLVMRLSGNIPELSPKEKYLLVILA
jgi:hypothetical protein